MESDRFFDALYTRQMTCTHDDLLHLYTSAVVWLIGEYMAVPYA